MAELYFRKCSLREVGAERWNRFAEAHRFGSCFHHSAWHETISQTYRYHPTYYILQDDGGEIQAGLAAAWVKNIFRGRSVVSYPYSDSSDPLVEDRLQLARLLAGIRESMNETGSGKLELRVLKSHAFFTDGSSAPDTVDFVLPLDRRLHEIYGGFHKSCIRRAISKAERTGIEIERARDLDGLRKFYRLHLMTRRKLGVPAQPFRFFRRLWENLFPTGRLSILLARKGSACAAGILLLKFGQTVTYKFGASDQRFLKFGSNPCLFWHAIQEAVQEGYSQFDFGRTSIGDRGLYQFKARWGARPLALRYVQIPTAETSRNSIQKNRLIACCSGLLQILPPVFTRMTGELFYRYFA